MKWIVCAAALIGIASSSSSANDIAQRVTKLYEQTAYKEGSELERCSAILMAGLRDYEMLDPSQKRPALKNVDKAMVAAHCFDKYSNVAGDPVSTTINPKGAERPRVDLVSTDLFITIPTFESFAIENAGHFIMAEIKKRVVDLATQVNHVIIDLRDNPGGSIQNLDSMLELFAPEAGIRSREMHIKESALGVDRTRFIVTKARGPLAGKAVTFLVNKKTESFAEWLIAILKYRWDPQHTHVLGDAATGNKFIVQCAQNVGDIRLKVTCAKWNDGYEYRKNGIVPDRRVSFKDCVEIPCIVSRIHQTHTEAQLK